MGQKALDCTIRTVQAGLGTVQAGRTIHQQASQNISDTTRNICESKWSPIARSIIMIQQEEIEAVVENAPQRTLYCYHYYLPIEDTYLLPFFSFVVSNARGRQ